MEKTSFITEIAIWKEVVYFQRFDTRCGIWPNREYKLNDKRRLWLLRAVPGNGALICLPTVDL